MSSNPADPVTADPGPCDQLVGSILVRRCGQSAITRCSRCQRAFCQQHAGAASLVSPGPLCSDCSADRSAGAGSPLPPRAPLRAGDGMALGVRIAVDADGFSDSDYAAFDRMSGLDQSEGRPAYDS